MSHTYFTESGVTVLELPWAAPPVTANQRLHFRARAKATALVRSTVGRLAAGLVPAMRRPRVTLVWLVTTRHRRDADNVVPTLKAACDGLVDAGIAADDTPEDMDKPMPIIHYAKGHRKAPGMFLVIWDSPEVTAEEERAIGALADEEDCS